MRLQGRQGAQPTNQPRCVIRAVRPRLYAQRWLHDALADGVDKNSNGLPPSSTVPRQARS